MSHQETVGGSYGYVEDSLGEIFYNGATYRREVSGSYTTSAVSIDVYGTVRESQTLGETVRKDDLGSEVVVGEYTTSSAFDVAGQQTDSLTAGVSTNILGFSTGFYSTDSDYNVFGTMSHQETVGGSYGYVEDSLGEIFYNGATYRREVSGSYTTSAVSIDVYGTVRESQTLGETVRKDDLGSEVVVGEYTTSSAFDVAGQQTDSLTAGVSTNILGFSTGFYSTDSDYNVFGTMSHQETVGGSYGYVEDSLGEIFYDGATYRREVSGSYTTSAATIDVYGTVRESQTLGETVRKDDLGAEVVVGEYTTSSLFDVAGQQTDSLTAGVSTNILGYSTDSDYNVFGTMSDQETVGGSYGYVEDSLGEIFYNGATYRREVSGSYTTSALSIDVYGTVRESQTLGETVRKDDLGAEVVVGEYTTESAFDVAGQQTDSVTNGVSTNILGFSTGFYSTDSDYNVFGTMSDQETVGGSYGYVEDSLGEIFYNGATYRREVSGSYTTSAATIDVYGTVRESQTLGETVRKDDLGAEVVVGEYTTESAFDVAGQQTDSLTAGVSTNILGFSTGFYSTDSDYNVFGTMSH